MFLITFSLNRLGEHQLRPHVLVTTGEEAGQQGAIERRRGKHYWWVRLENNHKTYRKESTLKRLSHGA